MDARSAAPVSPRLASEEPAAGKGAASPQKAPPASPPERPKLAPGVELVGQMRESAFRDPPWLIVRAEAGYLQVTELLYRVAEQCTGKQTIDEIAARITEAGTPVQAATIERIVARMLVPLGLVVAADGSVAPAVGAGRSALALSMQVKMLSPRLIDPVAGVLKALYMPFLLIPMLAVTGAAVVWLFLVHGIAGGIRDTLDHPGLMLFILLIVIVGTTWHEFGHAAALTYGGGRVRGMGVGLYLIYPAFYTDVTDNYRLGRWARVRTDLGGFYFNLMFSLAMVGLFFATGAQFLLIVALLLLFEIVQQTLPFVRLDGYWALVDLTGVPDFFSQIGPFLRSVLPIKGWQGKTLPPLKTWGKVVFGLYTLLIIPTIALLLVLAVKGLPRLLATAWGSFLNLSGGLVHDAASTDVLGVVWSAVQMLVLALPVVGLLYTLGRTGWSGLRLLWRWSAPSPARRALVSLSGVVLVALLVWAWTPRLPIGNGGPGPLYVIAVHNFQPIRADERGSFGDLLASVGVPGIPSDPAAPNTTTGSGAAPAPTPAAQPAATATPPVSVGSTATAGANATVTAGAQVTATANAGATTTAGPAASATAAGAASATAGAALNATASATPAAADTPAATASSATFAPAAPLGGAAGGSPPPPPAPAATALPAQSSGENVAPTATTPQTAPTDTATPAPSRTSAPTASVTVQPGTPSPTP